jgi:hypothetical protein
MPPCARFPRPQCCLLELINHEPPERSRAKRWARVLSGGSRPCAPRPACKLPIPIPAAPLLRCTSQPALTCFRSPRSSPFADATWPEVCRRYLLSTRAGKATLPEGAGRHSLRLYWAVLLVQRQRQRRATLPPTALATSPPRTLRALQASQWR